MELTDGEKPCVNGHCYEVTGWSFENKEPVNLHYLAGIYAKWDACTHWYFFGEDYDPEWNDETKEIDGYYHLCGEGSFVRHIRLMCFIWKVISQLIGDLYPIIGDKNNYFGLDITSELVELMLKDCEIVKVED